MITQEAVKQAKEEINRVLDVAMLHLATQVTSNAGVTALQRLKERKDKTAFEAETILEELSASIFLVGGRRFTADELANMPFGEILATCLPNHINFRIWPSSEGFRPTH